MAINPKAFYAESQRIAREFLCSKSTADNIVAARYLRGQIDDDIKPTPGGQPRITTLVRTEAEILKDDEKC